MNLFRGGFFVVLSCLLSTAIAIALDGQQPGRRQKDAAHSVPLPANQDLLDLIRKTQDLAEKAQAESRSSREQNEHLRQLFEQTHQELIQLRQEISELRSRIARPQSDTLPAVLTGNKPGSKEADQVSGTTETDLDLANRLAQMDDRIAINAAQIKEQAQTKIESDSRFRVRLFGTVLSNFYYNTAGSSEEAMPVAAPPSSTRDEYGGNNLGATLRQSNFGFALTGPKLGGAALSADVDFDFFGGTSSAYEGNVLGALRMRTASARIDGTRTSIGIGLTAPMISPLNPASLAAVYYPALGESGNLWQWRPQIVVERRTPVNDEDRVIVQGGLMMPFGETINGEALPGRPGYESRIAFSRSLDAERRMEIGAGFYFHPRRLGFGRTVNSHALTGDWLIPLHHRLEFSGEAFYGKSISLGEESGGNIADMFAFRGPLDDPSTVIRGIHSAGGWAQLSAKAASKLEFNVAFGMDDRRNRDIYSGQFDTAARLRNQTFSANSIYRLRSNFLISLEYRRMWTAYPNTWNTSSHFNLAVGYAF